MAPNLSHIVAVQHIEDLHRAAERERLVRLARSDSSAKRQRRRFTPGRLRRRLVVGPDAS
jgi:hypothetical protein